MLFYKNKKMARHTIENIWKKYKKKYPENIFSYPRTE